MQLPLSYNVCERAFSQDKSDSVSGNNSSFCAKVVAQKKIYNVKNPVCIPHQRKSETCTVKNQLHLWNGRQKRQSRLQETVILAQKEYLKITLLVKIPLHEIGSCTLQVMGSWIAATVVFKYTPAEFLKGYPVATCWVWGQRTDLQ